MQQLHLAAGDEPAVDRCVVTLHEYFGACPRGRFRADLPPTAKSLDMLLEDLDGDDFALVSNFPRASSRSAESRNTSLAELGLWPNCSLFVEEVDEGEVEDELDEREAWAAPEDE